MPKITPKKSWFWFTDTQGHQSVSLTFATISFAVTTLAYITSMVQNIGPVTFRNFDVGACGAYFGTVMALYFGRKFTEAKFKVMNGNVEVKSEE
jgi:hypothetical protein